MKYTGLDIERQAGMDKSGRWMICLGSSSFPMGLFMRRVHRSIPPMNRYIKIKGSVSGSVARAALAFSRCSDVKAASIK